MKTLLVLTLALTAQTLSAQEDRSARFLTDRRCSDCHSVSALKIKGIADVGPDLTTAYADVPTRYGMTLERFFDQPPGIMRMMLGGRPALEPAERDSLVALFRDLYDKQLARLDSLRRMARPVQARPRTRKEAL